MAETKVNWQPNSVFPVTSWQIHLTAAHFQISTLQNFEQNSSTKQHHSAQQTAITNVNESNITTTNLFKTKFKSNHTSTQQPSKCRTCRVLCLVLPSQRVTKLQRSLTHLPEWHPTTRSLRIKSGATQGTVAVSSPATSISGLPGPNSRPASGLASPTATLSPSSGLRLPM